MEEEDRRAFAVVDEVDRVIAVRKRAAVEGNIFLEPRGYWGRGREFGDHDRLRVTAPIASITGFCASCEPAATALIAAVVPVIAAGAGWLSR